MNLNIENIESIQLKISAEKESIEEYEFQIIEMGEEIYNYEIEYDYKSDPYGNDYDLKYISDKNEEILILENLIKRCEIEIDIYEQKIVNFCNSMSKMYEKSDFKDCSIDDIRKKIGYISSSKFLKLWIERFGIKELVNDLRWIYRDDINEFNNLKNILNK